MGVVMARRLLRRCRLPRPEGRTGVRAAIPIIIIAVGMGSMLGKKNMLGQNVIIESIGASSGVIVAGAIFTLPALSTSSDSTPPFWQVSSRRSSAACWASCCSVPFRKYFVKEMRGQYPFPEATASTEVNSSRARRAAIRPGCSLWRASSAGLTTSRSGRSASGPESVSTRICTWGAAAADKFKVVFSLNTSAAVLGLGYIIGLKYALIITAGSCLVWFVIVPVVGSLAGSIDPAALAATLGVTDKVLLADPAQLFTPENLFAYIGEPLGIGGIAMAGIIGISSGRRSSVRPWASPSREFRRRQRRGSSACRARSAT